MIPISMSVSIRAWYDRIEVASRVIGACGLALRHAPAKDGCLLRMDTAESRQSRGLHSNIVTHGRSREVEEREVRGETGHTHPRYQINTSDLRFFSTCMTSSRLCTYVRLSEVGDFWNFPI
jgi:hypothetical protein